MDSNIKVKSIYIVLLNMIRFLDEKNELLLGESLHIKRSIKFIKGDVDDNQFEKECEIIIKGLSKLIEKLDDHRKDIKNEIVEIERLISSQLTHEYLEKILLYDCMRERGYSFAYKLEYFYRAYENLINSHRYLYIPTPSISRRVKTSNLMLYFNQQLNQEYWYLHKSFFNIEEKDNEDKSRIISTWSFSPVEHLKIFDETDNQYVSFSFWFFEKQHFAPIAFHEVAHALFTNKNNKNFKLGDNAAKLITNQLFIAKTKDSFHSAMVHTIYQDIIADLSAYIITGESYVHALFYTGFMRGIHKNFYKDIEEESLKNEISIKDNHRKCINRHKNLTLLAWRNIDKDFISFFVRLKILINLHKEIILEEGLEVPIELRGIENIINSIYPENSNQNIRTFEDIVAVSSRHRSDYLHEKNFVLLAAHLLQMELFSRKDIIPKVKRLRKERKNDFTKTKIIEFLKNDTIATPSISSIVNKSKNQIASYYDLIWKIRFELVLDNPREAIPSGRIMRLNNLCKLGIFDSKEFLPKNIDDVIYELILFKFNSNVNPMISFKKGFKKLCDSFLSNKVSYAFGPYDIVCIGKETTSDVDKKLKIIDKDLIFFTERHALYKLKNYNSSLKEKNGRYFHRSGKLKYFDLSVAVSMKKDFIANSDAYISPEGNLDREKSGKGDFKEDFKILQQSIQKLDALYNKAELFISMGNENFLIYFYGISSDNIDKISHEFYSNRKVYREVYSTILLNENSIEQDTLIFKKDITFNNTSLVLLCKLKELYYLDEINIEDKIKILMSEFFTSTKLYKLFGIFDYKIVIEHEDDIMNKLSKFIEKTEDIFMDTQLEYQQEYCET